jgi:hypothetical protein
MIDIRLFKSRRRKISDVLIVLSVLVLLSLFIISKFLNFKFSLHFLRKPYSHQ